MPRRSRRGCTLNVTRSFADSHPIVLTHGQFHMDDVVPITRAPSTDWPMFRRCSAGSSYVELSVAPPLRLA